MYSGKTISKRSGRIIGVHQRIDRAARRNLNLLISSPKSFPSIKSILNFEGKNGPDGLKIKKSKIANPWHFINPLDPSDKILLNLTKDHIHNLAISLKNNDNVRSSFEAAWLAHAITDGLTPAHLVPFGDEIKKLFGFSPSDKESYLKKKIIKGKNRRDTLIKNVNYWGNGMVMGHFMFEVSVASAILSEKYKPYKINQDDIDFLIKEGFESFFLRSINKIFKLKTYENFLKKGMTRKLAIEVRKVIVPEIINCVTLAWYQAILLSGNNLD